MTSYTIHNTAGATVATINPATTTGSTFAIEMPGQGYSLYGQIINQNEFRMLENFSNTTPPSNPVVGQFWYNSTSSIKSPNFWDGTNWIIMSNSQNSHIQFGMAAGAFPVNFNVTGLTTIFTHPGGTRKYIPTGLMLQPSTITDCTVGPVFSMQNLVANDISEPLSITTPNATKFGWYPIEGLTEPVTPGNSIRINVTTAAVGGGSLNVRYNAFLFGWIH